MPDREDQASKHVHSWWRKSGIVVTLAAVFILEIFRRAVGDVPSVTSAIAVVLLATVLFASFQAGLRPGLISAALAILYAAYAYSTPGTLFRYAPGADAIRILVVAPSLAAVALVVGILRDRVDRVLARERTTSAQVEEAARWSSFLAEAGRLLSSSLDYETTMRTLAELAVPTLADWCGVDTLGDDGEIHRLAAAHVDPAKVELVREIARRLPPAADAPEGVAKVLRTGEPELLADISDVALYRFARDEADAQLLRDVGTKSLMIVPLVARGRILGSIALVAGESNRRYGEADLTRALDVAGRAALAIDNARLYEETEHEEQRSAFLSEASRVLASSLDYRSTLRTVARLAVPGLADYALIDLVEGRHGIQRLATVHRDIECESLLRGVTRRPAQKTENPIGEVLRTGEPRLIAHVRADWWGDTTSSGARGKMMKGLQPRSAVVVPLAARGKVLGVMTFAIAESARVYGPEDLALAEEVARRAAVSIDHARLYETAIKASQAKTDFLAVMSHELRTPLNAIMGYADLLTAGVTGSLSQEQKDQIERVELNARHLLTLIEEILTFSRIERGREEITVERFELSDLVHEVASRVEPLTEEKGLALRVITPDTPTTMETDPGKLRQILLNLFTNAVKFTDEGEITLRAEATNGDVVLQLHDTGIGISPGDEERIFEPFWQVEQGATRRAGGTGLGLSVTKRLARMLGGDIEVESEPGRGSTFTVRLPLRADRDSSPPQSE